MSGFWWAVLAAVAWGFAPVVEKAGLARVQPMTGLFYRCLGVLVGTVLLGLFVVKADEIKSVDPRSAAILMGGGFLASIVGQTFFYNALKNGDVSRLVPVSGSYPFIAFILGVLMFGESVTPLKIAGALAIVAGVWLLKIG